MTSAFRKWRTALPLVLIAFASSGYAQQHAENGWALSPRDTLRLLIFFVEVDYSEEPALEHYPEGNDIWPKGGLPVYADSLFDVHYSPEPRGLMSRYYREISLGNLVVLGDYFPELQVVTHAEAKSGASGVYAALGRRFGADSLFFSRQGLSPQQFDFWAKSPGQGKPIPRSSGFEGVDHVMVITRNYHRVPTDNGQASSFGAVRIAGHRCDTHSIFGGGRKVPFGIMKHELNHLFLGGNNFHSGGGNAAMFQSYLFGVQGGWSMMGAANSSLLTCAGWDRYRLGWKAQGNNHLISARDASGHEVNGDLDARDAQHAGRYLLRDFASTGDALRIKLPYIPDNEFQQWLWIENHTTTAMNGSPFDKYQYAEHECTAATPAGLFMQMQIDADEREGSNIYNAVMADYLRPVLANGYYDIQWEAEKFQTEQHCVNTSAYEPYTLDPVFENALSGNHEQEVSYRDIAEPYGRLDRFDALLTMTKRIDGGFERLNFMGGADHAFQENANACIGMGSNPSSASMLTLVNSRTPRKPDARNNTAVHLNGIKVSIEKTYQDGSILLDVGFGDVQVAQHRRWCAPGIILYNHNPEGDDLEVLPGIVLQLARGETPTRFDKPDTLSDGRVFFTSNTVMQIREGASMKVGGTLLIKDDSTLELEHGGRLSVMKGAKVNVGPEAVLHCHEGSKVMVRGRIRIGKGGKVMVHDADAFRHLRKRTCQKRRVLILD